MSAAPPWCATHGSAARNWPYTAGATASRTGASAIWAWTSVGLTNWKECMRAPCSARRRRISETVHFRDFRHSRHTAPATYTAPGWPRVDDHVAAQPAVCIGAVSDRGSSGRAGRPRETRRARATGRGGGALRADHAGCAAAKGPSRAISGDAPRLRGQRQFEFPVNLRPYLSWYQTFIGDYSDALQSFSIKEELLSDDAPSPLGQPGWHPVPARGYIPTLARSYKAVFLNEAHNVPLTRSLTVQLLKALRAEGFNTFAAETLYRNDSDLQKRGYPIAASGFYTREPVYAEMVREALKLGYKVVAYEADDQYQGDAREAQQARHLANLFKDDPNTRLVVNAGYAHIQKQGKFLGAQSMAEHFIEDTGIQPLAVEQTMLISHDGSVLDHPYYTSVVQSLNPSQPIVFVDKDGKPWSLRPGYDVSVFFPMTHLRDGRPT